MSTFRLRRLFSKKEDNREIVPSDIAEKGKKEGVIQKDKNGNWRIISFRAKPPRFWDAKYETKAKAEAALKAYQANRH